MTSKTTRPEPVAQYSRERIGWELERTAMGDGFYGNALRVAKDFPELTVADRSVLDRYATGAQRGTDHVALQVIAMKIYTTPQAEYPMQPIHFDPKGTLRFEENPIISYLACEVSDLNHLAIWCASNGVDGKYQEQLAQLIGYSVSGYGTLSYVTDDSYERAESVANNLRRQAEGERK